MIRLTSETTFPYGWPGGRICYFTVVRNRPIPMRYRGDMRTLLEQKRPPTIYAVWPGEYRSDLFVVDEIDKLRKAVGMEQ